MFFFAGPGAVNRALLAKRILQERFQLIKLEADEIRFDLLGLSAIHGEATPQSAPEPYEVGIRVAARTREYAEAFKIGREVDGMAVCGVGMTGKRGGLPNERVREVIGLSSSLVARENICPEIVMLES